MKRMAGGGFDFVVQADLKRKGIEPGTHESFMEIVRVISCPEPDGNRPIRIGDPRWNM